MINSNKISAEMLKILILWFWYNIVIDKAPEHNRLTSVKQAQSIFSDASAYNSRIR